MNKTSRRALARYAADQLLAGKNPAALAKQLVAALAETGRANDAEFLVNDIAWELEHRQELAIGRVTSASPLSAGLEVALKTQIKNATDTREVVLEKEIDKSLLGGLKVETSGRVWNMSIARELMQLRESF